MTRQIMEVYQRNHDIDLSYIKPRLVRFDTSTIYGKSRYSSCLRAVYAYLKDGEVAFLVNRKFIVEKANDALWTGIYNFIEYSHYNLYTYDESDRLLKYLNENI